MAERKYTGVHMFGVHMSGVHMSGVHVWCPCRPERRWLVVTGSGSSEVRKGAQADVKS